MDHLDSWSGAERRGKRSSRRAEALQLQLDYVKRRLALSAIVLCDDLGGVVAASGRRRLVQHLAEQTPWLIATPERDMRWALRFLWDTFPGIKERHISVRAIDLKWTDTENLILCGVGDSRFLDAWMEHATVGIHRILRTTMN